MARKVVTVIGALALGVTVPIIVLGLPATPGDEATDSVRAQPIEDEPATDEQEEEPDDLPTFEFPDIGNGGGDEPAFGPADTGDAPSTGDEDATTPQGSSDGTLDDGPSTTPGGDDGGTVDPPDDATTDDGTTDGSTTDDGDADGSADDGTTDDGSADDGGTDGGGTTDGGTTDGGDTDGDTTLLPGLGGGRP